MNMHNGSQLKQENNHRNSGTSIQKSMTQRKFKKKQKINGLCNTGHLNQNNDVLHNIFYCLILQIWMILLYNVQ